MNQPGRSPFNRNMPLLFLAGLSLLIGIWAGLIRMGLELPSFGFVPPGQHGALMIVGFLATLISLERVVAINQGFLTGSGVTASPTKNQIKTKLYYLVPALSAVGALLLLFDLTSQLSVIAFSIAAVGFVLLNVLLTRRFFDLATLSLLTAALLYLAGCIVWLVGSSINQAVPWWIAFLIVTIAGERLELTRIIQRKDIVLYLFVFAGLTVIVGLFLSLVLLDIGIRLVGLGFLLLAIWLLYFDIARRTIRRPQLTGYIAASLLLGFIWLGVGGLLWIIYGGGYAAGPVYDAMLHALLIGFVFSMIFGHAPVILPGVTGRPMDYFSNFYLPLALLHLSLILRLAGDFLLLPGIRRWGGISNGIAIVLFLVLSGIAVKRSGSARAAQDQESSGRSAAAF
jgi:hypothetical protein